MTNTLLAEALLAWFAHSGRKDLPWQHPRTPYRVWIAEIMLQQTQVKTVIPYFERFITQFPELTTLANAPEEAVLAAWSGLGYYSRARYLYKTAQIIAHECRGEWPKSVKQLSQLPGIGRSTAAASTSQAFNQATAILDANVKRVLCRYFMVAGYSELPAVKTKLWELAESCMPNEQCADYTQAIMDLGATCCTSRNPQCASCPLEATCLAYNHNRVSEFPHKKIKKKIPTKAQQFLLILNESQQIFLKKNPPSGIWGSLWCLPCLEIGENPQNYLNQLGQFNCLNQVNDYMTFKHTFTHFHLMIQVVLLEIKQTQTKLPVNSQKKWFNLETIKQLGIPKPVQKIIDTRFRTLS